MRVEVTPSRAYIELVDSGFFKGRSRRPFIEYAIRCMEHCLEEGIPLMVIAPPGIGKTTIAYSAAIAILLGYSKAIRVIHVLPLRSIIDDIHRRFAQGLKNMGIDERLNIVSRQYSMLHGSPYLQATYVSTTIDTYAFSVLKIPIDEFSDLMRHESFHGHYEIPRASIYSAINFLDEAHLLLEDITGIEKGSRFLRTLTYHFTQARIPLILLTATLPSKLTTDLISNIMGKAEVIDYREFVSRHGPDEFYALELEKRFKPLGRGLERLNLQQLIDRIDEIRNASKLCVMVNTVDLSIELYERFSRKCLLIHSKFTPNDREKKLGALKDFNLVVSTQVLEAGVDTSFDIMLTELAPISSLIQRLGRLARGENREGLWLIFYDEKTLEGRGIYSPNLIKVTLNVLENAPLEKIHWHLPQRLRSEDFTGYMQLIDAVWESFSVPQGLDVDLLDILERLDVDSRKVLAYLQGAMAGSFIRDEVLTPLYVGTPPEDYADFRRSMRERLVPMSLSDASRYVRHLIDKGYEVSLVSAQRTSKRGDLKVVLEDLKGLNTLDISRVRAKLREPFVKGLALALAIPQELYEGGVYGRGILWP